MEKQAKAKKCLERVLEYFRGNPEIPTVFMAGALSQSKILLQGSHGKGKTYVAELASKVLNMNLSIVQGSAGLTESKFLARYDVASLMKGEEVVDWKNFVDADMKLFDEINRTHPSILNGIFTMLARNRIDFGDESRDLKPYVFVGTMNPADSGTYNIPLPLFDRFDISILTESVGFMDKLMILKNHKKPIDPVLAKGELNQIWEEVEQMPVPEDVYVYLTTITRDLQLCLHGSKEFISNFPACCDNCRFKNWICSSISNESPVSERLYQSVVKVAKGLAYVTGKKEVSREDANVLLKYALYHRMRFVPTFLQSHVTVGKAVDKITSELNRKERERSNAYALVSEIVKDPTPEKVEQLDEWAKNDLLMVEISASVKERVEKKMKELEEKVKGMNLDELEKLQEKIDKGEVHLGKKTVDWVKQQLKGNLLVQVPKTVSDLALKAKLNRLDLKLCKEIRKLDLKSVGTKANGDSLKLEVSEDGVILKVKDLEQKKNVAKVLREIEAEESKQ